VALGRKAWLFCGSDRGGDSAAFMYTLIGTAKLNDLDPQAWLADILARIADLPCRGSPSSCLGNGRGGATPRQSPHDHPARHRAPQGDAQERRARGDAPARRPLRIRLDRLHLVLQAAMGWTNSHLYEFTAGGVGWGLPDPDFDGRPLPAKATLFDVIEDTGARTIHYVYDYGDTWDHVIRIERIGEPDPQALYPQLVAATGRCPPEDVGGPPGYAAFLAAIADPTHEEHEYMLTWCGGAFVPDIPDVEHIADELNHLARRWAPRPRKPKTTLPRS
jgi:hypothetical protein